MGEDLCNAMTSRGKSYFEMETVIVLIIAIEIRQTMMQT